MRRGDSVTPPADGSYWQSPNGARQRLAAPPSDTKASEDRDWEAHQAMQPVLAAIIADAGAAGWSEPETVMAMLQVIVERMVNGLGHSAAVATMQETIGLVRREVH